MALSVFTSYRIHSIYALRLFNDPIAVLFFYIALNLFLDRRWTLGSIFYSIAVGVKMNILLYAPAILMFYITSLGLVKSIMQLAICGIVQLILGAPFLMTYPVEYIRGSFDFGRIFDHKWTVNYRFLPQELFEDKTFHLILLVVHLILLIVVYKPCIIFFKNYARLRTVQKNFEPQIAAENREIDELIKKKMKRVAIKTSEKDEELTEDQKKFIKSFEKGMKQKFGDSQSKPAPPPVEEEDPKKVEIHFDQCTQLALLPIFLINFIGIACSRSLHYQFYIWYFHSLPHLVWVTNFHTSFKILLLFLIEYCWNQYPSTNYSSLLLHACHTFLLFGIIVKIYHDTFLARKAIDTNPPKEKEN